MNEAFFNHAKSVLLALTPAELKSGLEAAGFIVTLKHNNVYTQEQLDSFHGMVGQKVSKISGKPFKSKEKINTVKACGFLHPVTGRICFTFEEDETYVECSRCQLVTN